MTNNKVISSIITVSVALTLYSFNVKADDCSISINAKESVKCLQRKISNIEKQLEQSKKYQLILPKGAIVGFTVKTCPVGWAEYQENKKEMSNVKTNNNVIMCEKS